MRLFSICCGGTEEEEKYGAFTNSKEFDWDDEHAREVRENKMRIQQTEKQIQIMSKVRPQIRGTVCTRPVNFECDFQPPVFSKTESQINFLSRALRNNFIFAELSAAELRMMVDAFQHERVVGSKKVIIEKGEPGDFFYIVESGRVNFFDDGKYMGRARRGEGFGELALLYQCPRAVSVLTAEKEVTLWRVDQQTFRFLLARKTHDNNRELSELIRRISIFSDLDPKTCSKFIQSLTPVYWKKGDRIVQKGDVGNIFYIIREGKVKVHDIGLGDSQSEEQTLGPGDWFGERALLTGEPRAANVTALTNVATMAMDRASFESSLGPLQALIEIEMRKHFLSSIPIFANGLVTEPELEKMAKLMTEVCYRKGEKLAEAGQPYILCLWIIRHGQLLVYSQKSGKIFNLQSGDYFGDKSVAGDSSHLSSHTAVCEENLTAWVLTRACIENVIGDVARLGNYADFAKTPPDKTIILSDLEKKRILGRGAFGKVWLVVHREKNKAYALKAISKRKLLDSGQEKSVMREKEMLALLHHKFILHLISSFQDESTLYLLIPLVPGGELFSVLYKQKSKDKGLSHEKAAFYAACIIEALGHFHQRHIAYRDLKLENVLIDESGYCVIVDLGFAKFVNDRTYTLVGTPEYLAPEIILSKGHDKAVDYWAYGVLVYELLVGQSPFFIQGSGQMDMFKRIVLVKYVVPPCVSEVAQSLIKNLLVRRESARLGNLANGYLDVKNSEWFQNAGIDFKDVLRRSFPAPWKPDVKDPLDSSNFDDFSHVEKEVDLGRHLTTEEQALFEGF